VVEKYYASDIVNIKSLPNSEIEKISKNYGENANREMIIFAIQANLQLRAKIYEKLISQRK